MRLYQNLFLVQLFFYCVFYSNKTLNIKAEYSSIQLSLGYFTGGWGLRCVCVNLI